MLSAQHVIEVCKHVVLEQMSTFANSVRRTCAAVCPLYGDVPMGAPGPPGQKGPPGLPVSYLFLPVIQLRKKEKHLCKPSITNVGKKTTVRCGFILTSQNEYACFSASLDIRKKFCHGKQRENLHHTSVFSIFPGPC